MATLEVSQQPVGDIHLVKFVGSVDAHSIKIFEATLAELRAKRKFLLVFDCSGLSKINAGGLGALLEFKGMLDENAGRLVLLSPLQSLRKGFEFLDLHLVFPMVDDMPSAVRELVTGSKGLRKLEVSRQVVADILLVELKGVINVQTSGILQDSLKSVAKEKEFRVILDLSEVTFIDSSGLGVLVNFLSLAEQNSGKFVLVGASGTVRETFRLLEISSLFAVANDRPSALKLLTQQK